VKEIRRIIQEYEQIDFSTEKAALASVVNVEESSYRRIGARMLVRSNGVWTGGISGGCLERDALQRSQMAIFKNEATRVLYDTMDDDENQIGVGLGCNGRIEVVFTPLDPTDPRNEITQLKRIIDADQPAIMLKIIEAPDDSGLLGEHQLVEDFSHPASFVGIETHTLIPYVKETLSKKKPRLFACNVNGQPVKLLVEFIRPETRLIIVGDNYDVLAMLGIAKELGWETYLVGKAKKMSKAMFEMAKRVVDYDQVDELPVHDYTAVMLMSHDYNKDKAMLPLFAAKCPPYMGMLGPKKRLLKMQDDLGMDLENMDFLHAPTGLEVGAESPSEIALSIAAEIVAVFRKKPGGLLKHKEGTIYDRD
jgi:xanthine/CO dehydrogenase XdhC/CoxF family maturation factor